MPEPLSAERFRRLAETYGGTIDRWPEELRAEAAALAARDDAARASLERASLLDSALDAWPVPRPTHRLAETIVRSATRPKLARRARVWWAMVGVVVALAGAASGSFAAAAVTSTDQPGDGSTAFGDLGGADD